MTITYNPDTKTITVSNGTYDLPISFNDIYNADISNGWGVVEKISENIYKFYAKIYIYYSVFKDSGKVIIFADGVASANYTKYIEIVGSGSEFIIGEIANEDKKSGGNGCVFISEETTYDYNYFFIH